MSKESHLISITGGSGFIGSSVARYMAGKGFRVRIIDVKDPNIHLPNIEFVECDIRNGNSVENALNGSDIVVHPAIIQIPIINEHKRLAYDVNVRGLQNVCEVVDKLDKVKGLILTGSWHVFGERGFDGTIDETFGYRPNKVEDRAKLYAFSKIIQESIVRFYDEMSEKIFSIIRMGTVLGEGMPKETAANIFIEKGLKGLPITPYKHSMYRPMLYADIRDICKAFESFANKILNGEISNDNISMQHIVNVVYPEPTTIIELAKIVRSTIIELTNGKMCPPIEIVDKRLPSLFSKNDKMKFKVDVSRAVGFLGLKQLRSPQDSIREIVAKMLNK